MTLTLFPFSLLAYTSGSRAAAVGRAGRGRAPARSSGATASEARTREERQSVRPPSGSVVEDRLVGTQGLVQAADPVLAAGVLEEGATQIRTRHGGVGQVGPRQIGAHEKDLAQVRAGQVRAAEVDPRGVEAHDAHRLIPGVRADRPGRISRAAPWR